MKFKIGDKVRVRADLSLDVMNGVVSSMLYYRNCVYTITNITADGVYCKLDGNEWAWTEEMLEPAYADGGFCDDFRSKIPNGLIVSRREMERTTDLLDSLSDAWAKLGCTSFIMSPDKIKKMEEKKMSTKFTFYFNVNEGTRVDKSCNGTIPTITTSVVLDKFGDPNRRNCYSLKGEATCDKADYDMRQGVLEALANAIFDGNFEKAYDKAVKTNAFCERQDRTCHYCGKVLDTIEEKQAHEAWHVERKKARRERYLLRKRAKEIAFEEAAKKMAEEMIEGKK